MPTTIGKITSISVFNNSSNLAELKITVHDNNHDDVSMRFGANSNFEPQAFSSICNLLTSAYFNDETVDLRTNDVSKGRAEIIGVSIRR